MDRFLLLCVFLIEVYTQKSVVIQRNVKKDEWVEYKLKYKLNFTKIEDERRKRNFMENLEYVNVHNAKNTDLVLEINKFAHLDDNEFPYCFSMKNFNFSNANLYKKSIGNDWDLPFRQSIDYRDFEVIGPVINQGNCGSCYAFSSIGCLQSHLALRTGHFIELSKQDIVDCSDVSGNGGCLGGFMDKTFDYVRKYGISKEDTYPYVGEKQTCRNVSRNKFIIDWVNIPFGDENGLIYTLSFIGPVSIAMDGKHKDFKFYKSGVFKSDYCSSDADKLNHAVLAIGYSLSDVPYLIIKNSWGTDWGEDGYAKIALKSENMCGIACFPSYPIIKGNHPTP